MERSQTARLLAAAAAFTPSIPADDDRAVTAWHAIIGDLDYGAAARAVQAYYRDNRYPITPADIVHGVKRAQTPTVPHHLRCPDHPDRDTLAQHCDTCRRIGPDGRRLIEASNPGLIARVRAIAKQAQLDTRARDRERAAALQARADDAYHRRVTAAEKARQKTAYATKETR